MLSRVGAVRPADKHRFGGEGIVYSLSFEGLPTWVCEGLLGNFETAICPIVYAAATRCERGRAKSALPGHPDAALWRVYFRVLDEDDDPGSLPSPSGRPDPRS